MKSNSALKWNGAKALITTNQEIERYYFEQFKAVFPLPAGTTKYGDRPDVIIRGNESVGIEIANLFLIDGSDICSEQVQLKRREAVLKQAQHEYLRMGGKKINLSVSFNPSFPIIKTTTLASALATKAREIDVLPAGVVPRNLLEDFPQVGLIYHHTQVHEDAKWWVQQYYTVPSLAVERVAQIVSIKNDKLQGYETCDTYWLLLVVDLMNRAQDQDISWPLLANPVHTRFQRVIIYKPQFASWTDVPVLP